MPRYSKDDEYGYDLDRELAFCELAGVRVLAEGRQIILICRQCLRELSMHPAHPPAVAFHCHERPMRPFTFDLFDQLQPTMRAVGLKPTTVEYRRGKRLEREAADREGRVFGQKTEADYPHGYVVADESVGVL